MKRRVFRTFILLGLLVFIIQLMLNKINLSSSVGDIYHTLSVDKTEVNPGDEVNVTVRLNEVQSIPGAEKSIQTYIGILEYDTTKFEVVPGDYNEAENFYNLDRSTYVIGQHPVLTEIPGLGVHPVPTDPEMLEVRYKAENPQYLYIEVLYTTLNEKNKLTQDYDVVTISFIAKEGVSGTAEFKMVDSTDIVIGGYYPYLSENLYQINNSLANLQVNILGEAVEKRTITFNSMGGSSVDSIIAEVGTPISEPTKPTKTGYNFLGWYTSNDNGNTLDELFVFDVMPNEDITLYARWEEVTYTITYNLDGGTNHPSNPTTYTVNTPTITLQNPTKAGYNFVGWYTAPTEGSKVETIPQGSTENITLYARWEEVTYTITYNLDGGTNHQSNPATYKASLLPITLQVPTKVGYMFGGWYDNASFNGEAITSIEEGSTGNITLYAKWTPISYQIVFDANGGTGSMSIINANYDQTIILPSNGFTKEGYNFMGWATAPTGSVVYTDKASVSNLSTTNNGTVTLYAVWEEVTYTITYNLDGGTNHPSNPATYTVNTPTITLQNPTKAGYNFVGWYTAPTGGSKVETIPQGSTENITLYAVWEEVTYTITYNLDGGTNHPSNPTTYTVNTPTITLQNPTKAGYNFVGWYTAPTGGSKVETIPQGSTENITLYARWEEIGYALTFNPNYITVKRNGITLTSGTTVYKDQVLVITYNRLGYESATILVNGIPLVGNEYTVGIEDVVITVTDEVEITYTITYNLDGGTNHPSNPTTYTVNTPTITLQNPTKAGYNFVGWYTAPTGGSKVETIPQGSTENITLYARWEETTYTITYNLDGGTNHQSNPATYKASLLPITLQVPTKVGYMFGGWYDNASFNGEAITSIEEGSTGNITLYAKWTPISYQIVFDANGGTGSMSIINANYDQTIILPSNGFTKEGYNFMGWATTPTGSVVYTDKASVSNLSTTNNDTVTLYAVWEEVTYTITYNLDGGTNHPSNPATYKASLLPITLQVPTKVGYMFGGWYDNASFNGEAITSIEEGSTGNITLYAKWTPISYQIVFDANGGTGSMSIINANYDQTIILPSNGFTKEGYNFMGWATTPTGSVVYTDKASVSNLSTTNNDTVTLYAVWEEVTYTITYNLDGGTNHPSNPATYKASLLPITLQVPTKAGYNFVGWYTAPTGGSKVETIPQGSTENITLYARWEETTYTITYNLDGGTNHPSNPTTYTVNTPTITLQNPTKAGYNFVGWYTAPTGGSKVETIPQGSTENITLYARWEEIEGYNDVTLKRIEIRTKDNELIKSITDINGLITIILKYQYNDIMVIAVPTFDSTTVNSPISLLLEVNVEKEVEFEVTALSGNKKVYKVIFNRDSEPLLTNISFEQDIQLDFGSNLIYQADVEKDVSEVDIIVTTNYVNNKVYINGELVLLEELTGTKKIVLDEPGKTTTITIIVKSMFEEESIEYKVLLSRKGLSSEAKLDNLVVDGKTLYQKDTNTPGFDPNIYEYVVTIPFVETSISLSAIPSANATINIIYPRSYQIGENTVKVVVTSEDGTNIQEYIITVNRLAPSSIAEIEEIKVINVNTNAVHMLNDIVYGTQVTLTVPYEYNQVKFEITLTAESINATVINPGIISLVEGDNFVQIKAIAEDETEYIYELNIIKEFGDTNATLANLVVTDNNNKTYDFGFTSEQIAYAFAVDGSATSLKVLATPTSSKATVIVGDAEMNPYDANNILIEDEFDIYVWVIPQKGQPKAYVMRIKKDTILSTPQLNTIIISDGSGRSLNNNLNPIFKPDVYTYTLTVDYLVDELFIAGIGVDGARIISGSHTTNLKLLPQENIIEVVVENLDGSATTTYTFVVYRLKPSHIAELEYIKVNDEIILIEDGKFNYQLEVTNDVTVVEINPYTRLNVDSIVINGTLYNNMTPPTFDLALHNNKFTIVVTAEDRVTKQTYTLNIIRKDKSTQAKVLDVILSDDEAIFANKENGEFTPTDFNPNKYLHYIYVPSYLGQITMEFILEPNSTLEGVTGKSLTVDLDYGYNFIPIVVIAEDEVTKSFYFFVAYREELSSDCSIKSITLNNEGLTLVKKDPYTYTVTIDKNTKQLDLSIELSDSKATYQIVGNELLQDKDVVQIIVTAEDGTIGLYSIFVAQPSPTTSFSLDNNLLYIVIGLLVLLNIINLGLLISLNRRY